jgi:hypothetical protein
MPWVGKLFVSRRGRSAYLRAHDILLNLFSRLTGESGTKRRACLDPTRRGTLSGRRCPYGKVGSRMQMEAAMQIAIIGTGNVGAALGKR